jgi:hypothetical protein
MPHGKLAALHKKLASQDQNLSACLLVPDPVHVSNMLLLLLLLPQNPKDKRKIIIDEKLGTLFTNPLTMFSINKQLTKHIMTACEYC